MSTTPEYVVPAYELVQVLYQSDQAVQIYQKMTMSEREQLDSIMNTLACEKQKLCSRLDTFANGVPSFSIVLNSFEPSHNLCQYLGFLGYRVQLIPASIVFGNEASTLIIEW